MALRGQNSNLPSNARPWVRVLEKMLSEILDNQKLILKQLAYLQKRVK